MKLNEIPWLMPEEKDMVGDDLECNCEGKYDYCNCDFSFNDGYNQAIDDIGSKKLLDFLTLNKDEICNVISICIRNEINLGYKRGGIYPDTVAKAIIEALPELLVKK